MPDLRLTQKATSRKRVEFGKLSKGDASCSPLFVIITLIQETVRRSTAGYARSSYQSLRVRRGLCVTIGLILATARARPSACIRIRPVSYTHLRAHETPEHLVCRL